MTKREALDQIDKLKAYVEGIEDTDDKERDEWFLSVLSGLVIEYTHYSIIFRNKERKWMFQKYGDNGLFQYNHDEIFVLLEEKYKMKSKDIDIYVLNMLKRWGLNVNKLTRL